MNIKFKTISILLVALTVFNIVFVKTSYAPGPPQCTKSQPNTCCTTGSLSRLTDCESTPCSSYYTTYACTICQAYTTYSCALGSMCQDNCYYSSTTSHDVCTNVQIAYCNKAGSTLYQDKCTGTGGITDTNICRTSAYTGCTAPDSNCNGIAVDDECDGKGHRCTSECNCVCKPPASGDWVINSVCTVTDKTYDVTGNIIIQGSGLLELRGTTNIRFIGSDRYIYVYTGGQIHIYNTAGFNK